MGRIAKPWGYEDQILMSQVDIGDRTGMLGMRKLYINTDEMTSYAVHSKQSDIVYLEKGRVRLRIDGELHGMEQGEARAIRSGQKHQIQNLGENVAEVLEISFPYRPEDIERIEDPYSGERSSDTEEPEQ
jgi:mannose-6-phosphate isomerase-like protein (cupin superfamily)